MNISKKSVLTFFFILSFFSYGTISAESEIRMRSLENRINILEEARGCRVFSDMYSAEPRVEDGLDISLTASFIYWTARLDGWTYAKSGLGNLTTHTNPCKGCVKQLDWDFDPGFKVGMGWNLCHGEWDMLLQYTWFYTTAGSRSHSNDLNPGFIIFPSMLNGTTLTNPLKKAKAHWSLHYQTGDLELGHNFYVNSCLKLRPFIGIKGTWQEQDYAVHFTSVEFPLNTIESTFNFHSKHDHDIWGIGMRAGINSAYQFNNYFSVYGNFSLTGIWLDYDVNRKDTFCESCTEEIKTVNVCNDAHLVKPVIEFEIGLRLEGNTYCDWMHILVQAGWESQIWINQTLLINATNHLDRLDLNLHGVTAKLRLDF